MVPGLSLEVTCMRCEPSLVCVDIIYQVWALTYYWLQVLWGGQNKTEYTDVWSMVRSETSSSPTAQTASPSLAVLFSSTQSGSPYHRALCIAVKLYNNVIQVFPLMCDIWQMRCLFTDIVKYFFKLPSHIC